MQVLIVCYQRRNEQTLDPQKVTSDLQHNVQQTEQLLVQSKTALQGSDAVVELSRTRQPVLAKLEAIEAGGTSCGYGDEGAAGLLCDLLGRVFDCTSQGASRGGRLLASNVLTTRKT